MKRLLMVLVMGVACFGCSNDCDDAVDKLEECNVPTEGEGSVDADECDGQSECVAKCINDHSCAEIKDETLSGPYWNCVGACL
jgi:hypothetical protein